jgi:hypothetical protein
MSGPLDSAKVPTASVVGGTYNSIAPAPVDGQSLSLQQDKNGNLLVNVAVGGGGASSNVNIADVNGNPPALTNPLPVELSDGTQAFGTVSNPINIAGSISATNPSVGTTGAVAPTSATEIGIIVGGNLVGVSNANPVPVSGTISSGSLTNNNAAPGANNQGVLPAVANAAAPTWIEGNQVLESVDLKGNQRVILNAETTKVIGTANVVGTTTDGTTTETPFLLIGGESNDVTAQYQPVPLGAAGRSVIVEGVAGGTAQPVVLNAETTKVIGTVNQGTSPWVVSGTVTSSGTATVVGTLTNNNAAPAATEVGVLPALANAAAPTWTEGDQVLESVDLKGNQRVILNAETTKVIGTVNQGTSPWVVSSSGTATVIGTLTNNNAAPAATEIGVLPALANAAPPTWSEGDQVLESVDLAGNQRVKDIAAEASLATIATDVGTLPPGLTFIQAVASSAGTAISTLDKVFASPVTKNNVLLLMAMESGAAIPTWAKSAGTATVQSLQVIKSSATAPGFSLHAWLVTATGTLTMTATSGGSASVDMAAYAVEIQGTLPSGIITTSIPWWDAIQVSQGTAASFSFTPFYTEAIGELPYLFVGVGSVSTITTSSLGDPVLVSAASNATTGGAGNLQLFSAVRPANAAPYIKMGELSPTVTFSGSTLYTAVYISLRPYALSIAGSVTSNLNRVGGALVTTTAQASGTQVVGIEGSTGAVLDAVITAATAPANGLAVLSVNQTTAPSLTIGQSVALQSDYAGSVFVKPYRRGQTVAKATTISATVTTTSVLAAQTGLFADISNLIITVTAAASVDTPFTCTLSDGTASYIFDMDTGAIATAVAAPNPINISFNPPLPATSTATAWTITNSSATPTIHVVVVAVLQKAS